MADQTKDQTEKKPDDMQKRHEKLIADATSGHNTRGPDYAKDPGVRENEKQTALLAALLEKQWSH